LRVAIIGGCGFIGSHVADKLLEEGFDIRIIGRCVHGKIPYLEKLLSNGKAVEFMQADVQNFDSIEKATQGCDAIMHYAALINVDQSIEGPRPFFDVNVFGTFNILEIARKRRIPLVYKSTCEVFGNVPYPDKTNEDYRLMPRSPYATSKLCAERYCLAYWITYGLPIAISRGFNTYGPRQKAGEYGAVIPKFITSILKGQPPTIFGDGSQTRDYVYVKDVAEADALILEALIEKKISGGEIFNVCTGVEHSIRDIAKKVIQICNTGINEPIFIKARPGEVRRSVGTYEKIKKILEWTPKTSFENGLKETVRYFTDNIE